MDMKNVGLYLLIWVNVFLLVKAQIIFDPDPAGDVQLQSVPLQNVTVITEQCFSSTIRFKVQYVRLNDDKVVYTIKLTTDNEDEMDGFPIACNQSLHKYRIVLNNLQFIADPVLVGGTFKLKVTMTNTTGSHVFSFSKRTYSFPAPFNLTGSSVKAVRYFSFTWTCQVTSNYPIIEWYRNKTSLEQSGFPNGVCSVTSNHNDSYIYNCQEPASTYTLTIPGSSLTEELQGSTWRCKNVTGEVIGSKFMELDIVYPPTVSLYLENTTENANLTMRCIADRGKPANATVVALQQWIGSTFIRNITSFKESSPGNITVNIPRVSYQDMGTYTCLASNGIPDRSNQTIQSDIAYLNVNTSAKFEMMNYTVRSDINTPAIVRIPFYRNPTASEGDVVWTKNTRASDEKLETSANFSFSLSDGDVQQTLHGEDVTLRGQFAIMKITSFQSYFEGNYTLKIKGIRMDSSEVRIVFSRSGPPDTPLMFKVLTRKVTSVVLTWNKGSDGGHNQTFVILYREKKIEDYRFAQIEDTATNINVSYEIKDLKPDTSYEFILYSFNEKGNSTDYKALEETTLRAHGESTPSSLNAGLVGGALGGGAAILVVVIIVIVVVRRRRNKEGKGHEYNSRETLAGSPKRNDDNEDGLKDNPLYGGSPSGANTVQGPSAAPGNPSVYAEAVKPERNNLAKVNVDPPPIYAEVNKSSKKNAKGEQYQNMDGFKQTGSTDKKKAKENEQRGYKNKDGLFYMDVKFDQPPTRGKPTIRKEEPTGYAMIQFEESNAKSTSSNARGAGGGQ